MYIHYIRLLIKAKSILTTYLGMEIWFLSIMHIFFSLSHLITCNLYVVVNGKTYLKVKLKELGFFSIQRFDILWETQSQMETFYNKLGNAISILMYFLFYKFKWIGRSCRNIHAIINHNHGELELQYDIPQQSYLFSRHLPSPVPGC